MRSGSQQRKIGRKLNEDTRKERKRDATPRMNRPQTEAKIPPTMKIWTRCDVFYMHTVSNPSSHPDYIVLKGSRRWAGGGYYFGSVDQERYSIQRLARKINGRVFGTIFS